ncbi:MAG: hypothetical protein ABJD97_08115 [Betaproteobacteria bacterium]
MPIFIQKDQFDALASQMQEAFLLECVADWVALRERIYGAPPRIGFDGALAVARHVQGRVAMLPQPPLQPVEYALIHTVLQAGERGARPDQLRRGIETYCRCLPSHDAGLILLEAICEPEHVA